LVDSVELCWTWIYVLSCVHMRKKNV
jgi:hypothetical protein